MSADTRLLIVPRWGGRRDSDFYPWLVARLRAEHTGRVPEIEVLDLPRPELPDVVAWPAAIAKALGPDSDHVSALTNPPRGD